jgi:uncharacterized protein YqeY
MNLEQQINADIKTAMLAKAADTLNALRAIKSAILLAKTEKAGTTELAPETELAILQKLAKQRKESFDLYVKSGREDLAREEEVQLKVIEKYLPAQLSDEALDAELKLILSQSGVTDPAGLGKVIGMASKALAGKADNGRIAQRLRQLLTS